MRRSELVVTLAILLILAAIMVAVWLYYRTRMVERETPTTQTDTMVLGIEEARLRLCDVTMNML